MWTFIAIYLVLNSLFFLPRYLLERKSSNFFPWKGLFEGPIAHRIQYIINRFNYDIFRFSADLFWGILLFFMIEYQWSITIPTIFIFLPLISLWIYHLYYHIFENIYKIEPLFYRDFLLLKTGAQLFFREITVINIVLFFGVFGIGIGFYYLLDYLLYFGRLLPLNLLLKTVIGIISLLSIYSLLKYNYKAYGKIVFPWSIQSLWRNIRQSYSTKRYMDQFDFQQLSAHHPYRDIPLKKKPNIYFIPIESYGKLLFTHPELKDTYHEYMPKLAHQLQQKDWNITSHLSTAPITGGASWVSYTTALFGFDIKDQGTYLTLLHKEEIRQYQHLMRWFQDQGYRNYRLSPIAGFKDMKIPWKAYQDFYAIDEWIKYDEMNYKGKLHGFGPCPPDQFSLNFGAEYIKKKAPHPFFLFFITQNSHSPFTPPYQITEDWKSLAQGEDNKQVNSSSIFVQPKIKDYAQAIEYQVNFITDFILKEGTEDDIFILIGDHQPPSFPSEEDGFETPIHIISKNNQFIEGFSEYGFSTGLLADIHNDPIKHQAFFSMFIREIAKNYGEEGIEIPAYLKDGIEAF